MNCLYTIPLCNFGFAYRHTICVIVKYLGKALLKTKSSPIFFSYKLSKRKPLFEIAQWATLGVHLLSWLLSNNRLEEVYGTLTKGTFSSRFLLSNQDKGCTPSVAHSLPLPLPPIFCSTCQLSLRLRVWTSNPGLFALYVLGTKGRAMLKNVIWTASRHAWTANMATLTCAHKSTCFSIRRRSDYIIGFIAPAIGPNKSKKLTRLIAPAHNISGKVWMKNNTLTKLAHCHCVLFR